MLNPAFKDFRNFLYAVWKFLGLPDPTPVQYDIAYWLQYGGDPRVVIEAFRGVGKSFILAAFVVWSLYWNPDYKVMVVSASKERADAFSQFCLRLIREMPELQHMIPRSDQRRSLVAFDVAGARVDQSPSVKSVGISGQMTGSRADLIVADDVETPRDSQTQVQREKLREKVKEFDAILKPLPTSRIVYLGTPQCEDSLYNELRKRGYIMRVWPARKPHDPTAYLGALAPFIENMDVEPGSPTDPKRFDEMDLVKREASYGRSGFALQFMLDTSLSDANRYPLKCSDFIVMDTDPLTAPVKVNYGSSVDQLLPIDCVGLTGDRWYRPMFVSPDFKEYTGSVMFIDPSGRGADKTAFAVVKMLNGTLYLTRAGSLDGGYDETTLTALALVAKNEKVNLVLCEENFGGGMFVNLLKPYLARHHSCNIEEVWHSKQKELRIIDTLEPVLNQHRLVVNKAIVQADAQADPEHQLFYQLTRITRDKNALGHDDLLDAVAGAVAYWVARMDLDQDQAAEEHENAKMQEEIDRFMENALGAAWERHNPNWTDTV